MTIHIRTIIIGCAIVAVFGFESGGVLAQSTGIAGFAARQKIKDQVLAAMDDGKISDAERRNILSGAKEILNAKEYVGLVQTINRLSPPNYHVDKDIGYNPVVDRQLMANFYAPELPFEKVKVGEKLANQSLVKQIKPDGSFIKEITPKQTILAKIMPKEFSPLKAEASQTAAKTSAPGVAEKNSKLALLPSFKTRIYNDKQSLSALGNSQKSSKLVDNAVPPPPSDEFQTGNTDLNKSSRQKIAESPKRLPQTDKQASIQQPAGLFQATEKTAIKSSYNDSNVPVLNTPAAALLEASDANNAIQTSYDQPLAPERQNITNHP